MNSKLSTTTCPPTANPRNKRLKAMVEDVAKAVKRPKTADSINVNVNDRRRPILSERYPQNNDPINIPIKKTLDNIPARIVLSEKALVRCGRMIQRD